MCQHERWTVCAHGLHASHGIGMDLCGNDDDGGDDGGVVATDDVIGMRNDGDDGGDGVVHVHHRARSCA